MKQITLRLTVEEVRLLATLAADQLFRKEFIDRRMPGNKVNPEEIALGKALVARLKLMVDEGSRNRTPPPPATASGYRLNGISKRQNRIPDAL